MLPPLRQGFTCPAVAAASTYFFQFSILQLTFHGANARRGQYVSNELRVETDSAREADSETYAGDCGGDSPIIQIFSDVDDTFFCSRASYFGFAGCDKDYGHKVVYPGYTQFALELSRGPEERLTVLKPGLLSARPANSFIAGKLLPLVKKTGLKMTKDSLEAHAFNSPSAWDATVSDLKLEMHGGDFWLQINDVPNTGVRVLTSNNESREIGAYDWNKNYSGTMGVDKVHEQRSAQPLVVDLTTEDAEEDLPDTYFGLTFNGSWYGQLSDGPFFRWMGTTKFAHMKQFFRTLKDQEAASNSALCVIFIGDNGQGDCSITAQRMSEFRRGGQLGMKAAFIHSLNCAPKDQQGCPIASAADSANGTRAPIIRFRNYLEAAALARSQGLIHADGFKRVAVAVNTFVSVYCHPDGESVEPRLVTDTGCKDLQSSMAELGVKSWPETPVLRTRSFERKLAFCAACCDSTVPSDETSYNLMGEDRPYHCREGYRLSHSDSFAANFWPWKPSTASVRDCSMCQSIAASDASSSTA